MRRRALERVSSQHQRTIRDRSQLDQATLAHQEIREAREHTEMELQRQLKNTDSFLNVEKVRALVFESDASMARTFLSTMLTAFDCDIETLDLELLYLIQDAWDCFPHRHLQGRCPAELMEGLFEECLAEPDTAHIFRQSAM
jgi:hypothetical protein